VPATPTKVPTYEQLMSPLLQVVADGLPHRVREAAKDLADRLFLLANLRDEPLPDGRNKLIHRLEWARTYLKKAGLLEYPGRGVFKITERGVGALKKGTNAINNKYLQQFPEFREFKSKKSNRHDATGAEAETVDPEEAIENAYQSVRAAVDRRRHR
jgi:restriction system protein